MVPRHPASLPTARLELRSSGAGDAPRALEILSNWNVARMLASVAWPVSRDETERWFAAHANDWADGRAYRFAILHDGRMIGLCDLSAQAPDTAELGYWLDEACWGWGFASEAARAVIDFGFDAVGYRSLTATHAFDNDASGRVLRRLGFAPAGIYRGRSTSRGAAILIERYTLASPHA